MGSVSGMLMVYKIREGDKSLNLSSVCISVMWEKYWIQELYSIHDSNRDFVVDQSKDSVSAFLRKNTHWFLSQLP